MKSSRITPAIERDGTRFRVSLTELPTLSEDGTLLRITKLRSIRALRFRRRQTLTGMVRAAGRQVLSILGLL